MRRRTKIVATMGPAVADADQVAALHEAGMDVARLNCSHGDWESKRLFVRWIRELDTGISPIAVMADLQGPKFRIGEIDGGVLTLRAGETVRMGPDPGASIPMKDDAIYRAMAKGDRVLFGDGDVEVKLGPQSDGAFEAKAVTGGKVKTRQGVTIVGKSFEVPCLTEKDLADIEEACRYGVDYIALSYVRRGEDMQRLRQEVDRFDQTVKILAKVETREAVRDIEDVIDAGDAVMVARGDLGLQVDIEDVPVAQKRIIARCNRAAKPVITATQMLESMLQNARPTRAEASDVANAILDGTDAVMLSGETASGAYPVEAVRTMARIANTVESHVDSEERVEADLRRPGRETSTEAVAKAAVSIANSLKVKAILTTSTSGATPRMVSKFRPRVPIYCATWSERVRAQAALIWGVRALPMPPTSDTDEAIAFLLDAFKRRKLLKSGDQVVVTAGIPPGKPGNTNMVLVLRA
jgi:pyruvate kinase